MKALSADRSLSAGETRHRSRVIQLVPGWAPRGSGTIIGVVVLAAVVLRLWGINYGLPFAYYPDEPFLVDMVRHMIATADLNPPDWDYPSVQVYSLLAIFTLRRMLSPVVPFLAPPWMDYLLGRLLSVAYAAATVYAVYWIGRRVFGQRAGLVAAAFVGFSRLHDYNSHFLTTDVPATFYVTATLALAIGLARCACLRRYAAAGALAGLAASTKYPAASVLVVLPVANALGPADTTRRRIGSLVLAGACAVLAFAVTSPYALIDPSHFWHSFTINDVAWAQTGHEGAEGNVLVTYLRWLFLRPESPVAWLALLGTGLVVIRRRWLALLVVAFPIVYFVTLLPWQVRFDRYLVPMVPCLSLLAAWTLDEGERLLAARGIWITRAWQAAIVALVLVQFWIAAGQSAGLAEEDVRTTALQWIEANLPPGSRIVREDYTPDVPDDRFRVTQLARAIDREPSWYRDHGVQYVILSNFRTGRYFQDPNRYRAQVAQYQQLLASTQIVREFRGAMLGVHGATVTLYRYAP